MTSKNEQNSATLIHFSGLLSFFFPFGGVLGPLLFWSLKKDESQFVDQEGKAAINFNLSFALYTFILGFSFIPVIIARVSSFINQLINNQTYHDTYSNTFYFDDFSLFGIFSLAGIIFLLQIIRIVFIINAGIRTSKGMNAHYPISIKFLKN